MTRRRKRYLGAVLVFSLVMSMFAGFADVSAMSNTKLAWLSRHDAIGACYAFYRGEVVDGIDLHYPSYSTSFGHPYTEIVAEIREKGKPESDPIKETLNGDILTLKKGTDIGAWELQIWGIDKGVKDAKPIDTLDYVIYSGQSRIISHPQDTTVVSSGSSTLSVGLSSDVLSCEYQWYKTSNIAGTSDYASSPLMDTGYDQATLPVTSAMADGSYYFCQIKFDTNIILTTNFAKVNMSSDTPTQSPTLAPIATATPSPTPTASPSVSPGGATATPSATAIPLFTSTPTPTQSPSITPDDPSSTPGTVTKMSVKSSYIPSGNKVKLSFTTKNTVYRVYQKNVKGKLLKTLNTSSGVKANVTLTGLPVSKKQTFYVAGYGLDDNNSPTVLSEEGTVNVKTNITPTIKKLKLKKKNGRKFTITWKKTKGSTAVIYGFVGGKWKAVYTTKQKQCVLSLSSVSTLKVKARCYIKYKKKKYNSKYSKQITLKL